MNHFHCASNGYPSRTKQRGVLMNGCKKTEGLPPVLIMDFLKKSFCEFKRANHARHADASATAGKKHKTQKLVKLFKHAASAEICKESPGIFAVAYGKEAVAHIPGVSTPFRGSYCFNAVKKNIDFFS